jgi:aminodeoxyfutalosine synthase
MMRTSSPLLQSIREKVEAGERLTFDDGVTLYRDDAPLAEVGELANLVRERKHGNAAYYNINTHLNPTNICVYRCTFCAFRADLREAKGYWMNDEQVIARGREAVENGCTELHIVGGLHHQAKYEWYRGVISVLHENFPELHLKAWTPVEIDWFSRLTKKPIRWVLEDMIEAGLGSMPGGGAEIFHPEVRNQICEHKADSARWFETHRTAHQLGLKSNCTMLYGHIENEEDRVDHLVKLRALQEETGGFQTFIPLAFHPANTPLEHISPTTGFMDLKNIAAARLLLDNIAHIKAYWVMMTPHVAQIALRFGANDIDGTVVEEKIYHDAGSTVTQGLRRNQLLRLIREAGCEPVERDTRYNRVERTESAFAILV